MSPPCHSPFPKPLATLATQRKVDCWLSPSCALRATKKISAENAAMTVVCYDVSSCACHHCLELGQGALEGGGGVFVLSLAGADNPPLGQQPTLCERIKTAIGSFKMQQHRRARLR